jgi:predicted aspartyl protease
MTKFSTTNPAARIQRGIASLFQGQFIVAAMIVIVSLSGAQARTETPEEVNKILAFLQAQNCEILRDAMGAKKLSAEENGFMVQAKCEDGQSYRFMLDQNFKVLSKKAGNF